MSKMTYRLQLDQLDGMWAMFRQGGTQLESEQRASASVPREAWEKSGRPMEIELPVGGETVIEQNRRIIQEEIAKGPIMPAPGTIPFRPIGRPVRDEPQA